MPKGSLNKPGLLSADDFTILKLIEEGGCPHCGRGVSLEQLGTAIKRHRMTARDRRDKMASTGLLERVGGYHGFYRITTAGKEWLQRKA